MTIERRIRITTVLLILYVVGIVLILFWSSHQVGRSIGGIETASDINRSAFMLRALMREYLEQGSMRILEQWERQNARLGQTLGNEKLSESLDAALLEEVRQNFQAVNLLYPRLVELRASTGTGDRTRDVKAMRMLTDLMFLQLEQLVHTGTSLSLATQTLAIEKRNFLGGLIVGLGILAVILILVNIHLIRKSVVHPLKVLSSGAERIGAGNFEYVAGIRSKDEVGILAQSFNTMVERLRERTTALREAKDELELRVEERDASLRTQAAMNDFLLIVNESQGTEQLIRAATTFFQERSGCDAVGIRLQERDDFPYYEARGFPEEFILLENHLCEYDENGLVQRDIAGNPILACMCGNVIAGRFDPSKPFFTERGSFWTNSTTELLAGSTEADRQARTRNRCNGEGYESVALIALRSGEETWGLLQLNDKRKERFTPEIIGLWERLSQHLAVALAKFRAEEELREAKDNLEIRVKERTEELESAKEAVTTERQQLYEVLETLPIYVCLLDADYRMPFANRYFRETFAEPLGRRCYEFLFNRSEPCEICETYTVMKTREPHHWYWTGPNGRDYDIYDFPFIDTDGSFLILEMGIDITERKQAEAAVQQTLADLTRSNADLEKFAYVASHDLQEPLRNVAGCLHLLEQKYRNKLDADADQYIQYAVEGAVRMRALIQDLLTYSRIGTRGKPPELIHCEQVLEQTVKNLSSAISEAGAVITHDPLPTIVADGTQLSQVFQNLIQNSIKFRRDEPPQIHISADKDEDEWIFSVTDNGIGIEPRHFDRIFEIFQRLNKRAQYDGTGIGLAIVKKVVERHRGRIWVESEPGKGTTFFFTIPEKGIQT